MSVVNYNHWIPKKETSTVTRIVLDDFLLLKGKNILNIPTFSSYTEEAEFPSYIKGNRPISVSGRKYIDDVEVKVKIKPKKLSKIMKLLLDKSSYNFYLRYDNGTQVLASGHIHAINNWEDGTINFIFKPNQYNIQYQQPNL